MPATNYAKEKELNYEFKNISSSGSYVPTTNKWYIGLSLYTIDEDGNGVYEPIDNGYKRVPIQRTPSYWTDASDGSLTNGCAVVFPQSTRHWGTIKEVFVSSSSKVGTSGSYIWFHCPLETPMAVLDGTKITIPKYAISLNRKEAG